MLKIDLDPTPQRVAVIAVLILIETMLSGLLVLLQDGKAPSELQIVTLVIVATLACVTYISSFVKQDTEKNEG